MISRTRDGTCTANVCGMTKFDSIASHDLDAVTGGDSQLSSGLSLFRKLIVDPTRSMGECFDPLSLASPRVAVSSFGRDEQSPTMRIRVPRRVVRGTTKMDVKPARSDRQR
jgi:hypothetical protein